VDLRAVQHLQLTISIHADKGLLHKSSVVRLRLRLRPDAVSPDDVIAAEDARPPAGPATVADAVYDLPLPTVGQRDGVDEILDFPSEQPAAHARHQAVERSRVVPWGRLRPPGSPLPHFRSMLRISTVVAFAAGVVVGAVSGNRDRATLPVQALVASVAPSNVRVVTPTRAADSPRPLARMANRPPEPLSMPVTIAASPARQRESGAGAGIVDAASPQRPRDAARATTVADGVYRSSLMVDSTPVGAGVFLNNRPVGSTPLTVDGLAVGSRVVRLELPGYQRWSSAITVTSDRAARVSANLYPLEQSTP
jgi:hypothetical protein